MRMKWKKRLKYISALRAKHGTDRRLARPFPDLTVEFRGEAPSNKFDKAPKWKKA